MNQQLSSAASVGAANHPKNVRRSYPGHIAIPAVTIVAIAVSLMLLVFSNEVRVDSSSDFFDVVWSHGLPIVIIAGMFAKYQALAERSQRSSLVVVLRILAGLIAIVVIFGTLYLSATLDDRLWRNSFSAYQHSSGGPVFAAAGLGLAFLLITEATTQAQWTILGRTVQLHKAFDEVRIGSAFLAFLLVIYPTAPEGGDLYSNSSVLHGFSSLGLFLGLILLVCINCIESGKFYMESKSQRDRNVNRVQFMFGWLLFATVMMCITVVVLKVGGNALFVLEIVALILYFASFTLRNRERAMELWQGIRNRPWFIRLVRSFVRQRRG